LEWSHEDGARRRAGKKLKGIGMTQVNAKTNTDGSGEQKTVNWNLENVFFENQIVPMWASTKVAASILGITPNALRIRKHRGEVSCRYFGRHLRFDVNQLVSLIRDERTTKGLK